MTWISSHATDQNHRRILLLEWTIGGSTYYWAAWDVPVVTTGLTGAPAARWTPKGFTVSGISSRQGELIAEATIEIENGDGVTSAIVLAAGGSAGSTVKVWEAWLNPTGDTSVSEQDVCLVSGLGNSLSIQPEAVTLKTSPPASIKDVPIPRRLYSTNCTVGFKSASCGYAGVGTSCDRFYATCLSYSNEARFCGFYRLEPLG